MRILIVEDETAAYENLADMLVTIDPTIEIMGNTESVRQTVRWLQANPRPDLIFMDIHLSIMKRKIVSKLVDILSSLQTIGEWSGNKQAMVLLQKTTS